ncbi:MAG: RMD1 family protein [Oligoflexia bacterium]|nr:RMD1 family protein [Oligoflexia bacterium]
MEHRYLTAYNIADKIPLRQLRNIEPTFGTVYYKSGELVEIHTGNARMYVFASGTIVFFNCPKAEHEEMISNLISNNEKIFKNILYPEYMSTSDNIMIAIGDKIQVDFDSIILTSIDDEALRIAALMLSDSIILDYYENYVEEMLVKSHEFSTQTRKFGRLPRANKRLMRFIGECMQTKQAIITNLFVLDNPPEIWEDHALNFLYHETRKLFEISYRFKTIDYKLKTIQENLSLLIDLSSARSGLWLELIIVLLILTEIIITLVNHFL